MGEKSERAHDGHGMQEEEEESGMPSAVAHAAAEATARPPCTPAGR